MFKKVLKWVGIALAGLVALLAVALVVLYLVGTNKLNKKYQVSGENVPIPSDSASIQRGEHLATIFMCSDCHTANMGGQVFYTVPGMLTVPTPNLTSGAGGAAANFNDQDWVRAIRHGVGPDGKALFIMPSGAFHEMSDADLGAVIAYIQSLPPVNNLMPVRRVEIMGRVMMGLGMFPPFAADQIEHSSPPLAASQPGVTVEYGRYLTRICTGCHGADLNGAPFGPPGQEVPTPNLTPGGELASWSEQDFMTTFRSGLTPAGRKLSDEMPWKYFGQMSDDELKAVWMYLHSLPALEQGG